MSDATETEETESGLDIDPAVAAAIAQTEDWLVRQEKAANRISHDDWDAVMGGLRKGLIQIVESPFVAGDLEAENLVNRVLASADFEDFNLRLDTLSAYLGAKAQYNLVRKAQQEPVEIDEETGEPVVQSVVDRNAVHQSTNGISRRAPTEDVSGSDFEGVEGADAAPVKKRRKVLRL